MNFLLRMSVAIKFEGVSKKFKMQQERARSFQEVFVNGVRRKGRGKNVFWVLKDVSFQVEQGESVALIGVNGAGKSTVLKLISQILFPTSGEITINGRISSLLELGTGFHPDLTGRENIYLNGSMLGLGREEIDAKYENIVAFSEMADYIDMPVKHYSSGMYLRLAFSVAIHVEPDILLVDEALAVGDAAFQRKCLDRIDRLRQQGVTIVLVSHSLSAVRRVCQRALWLEQGRVVEDGSADSVLKKYLWHSFSNSAAENKNASRQQSGSGVIYIERVRFLNKQGEEGDFFATGDTLTVEMHYCALQRVETPVFGIGIHRSDGIHITGPNTGFSEYDISAVEKGHGIMRYTIPKLPLLEGTYYVSLSVSDRFITQMYDYHDQMYTFRVVPSEYERYGVVSLGGVWSLEEGRS